MKNLVYNLLIRGQKFTGTDNIYLAKYGSYLTIGNIITMVASFLLSIAFAHFLPKEIFGQYKYILSLFGILAIASLPGMNAAIIQGVAQGQEGILKKGWQIKMKWSLLGSLAALIMGGYFFWQNNVNFTFSLLIIAVLLPFFNSSEVYHFFLDGKKLFGQRVAYTTITQVLSSLIILITIFSTNNLLILIAAYFLPYSLLRTLFLLIVIKKNQPDNQYEKKNINYGKHLSFMIILNIISQQIDKILLFAFLGPIQLAIYSFATLPVQYIITPFQHIKELALPKLVTKSETEIKKTLTPKLLKSALLILIVTVIYIILIPYLFQIFYPQYLDSILYSRVYALTLLIFPASVMALALQAKMKTKELYKINIIDSIIKIALMVILIPTYGVWGIITAILISQLIYSIIVYFYFKKM